MIKEFWALGLALLLGFGLVTVACDGGGDSSDGEFDDDSGDDDSTDDDDLPKSCDSENYAMQVIDYELADNGGFGEDELPDNITGPPDGRGDFAPQSSAGELLSLGDGGYVVLKLGREVVDADGPDLVVFENSFYKGGDVDNLFTEAAVVEVSQDGNEWHRFPFDYDPTGEDPWKDPDNYLGLAGINPVYAKCSADDFIDPLEPEASGGDLFDLADVGLEWAAYIKIIDAGNNETNPGSQIEDADGDPVDDSGNHGFSNPPMAGFDLDAVGVINGGDVLEPDEK